MSVVGLVRKTRIGMMPMPAAEVDHGESSILWYTSATVKFLQIGHVFARGECLDGNNGFMDSRYDAFT